MVIRAAQEASVLGAESPSTSKEVQDLYEVQFAGLNSRVGKRKGLSNPEVNLYTHTRDSFPFRIRPGLQLGFSLGMQDKHKV